MRIILVIAISFLIVARVSGGELVKDFTPYQICKKEYTFWPKKSFHCERVAVSIKHSDLRQRVLEIRAQMSAAVFVDGFMVGTFRPPQTFNVDFEDVGDTVHKTESVIEVQLLSALAPLPVYFRLLTKEDLPFIGEIITVPNVRPRPSNSVHNFTQLSIIIVCFLGIMISKMYLMEGIENQVISRDRTFRYVFRQEFLLLAIATSYNFWVLAKSISLLSFFNQDTLPVWVFILLISLYPAFKALCVQLSGVIADVSFMSGRHLAKEFRLLFLFSLGLCLLLLVYFYNPHVIIYIDSRVIFWLLVVFLSSKTAYFSFFILKEAGGTNISTFSYLCGSELIPYILFLKILFSVS